MTELTDGSDPPFLEKCCKSCRFLDGRKAGCRGSWEVLYPRDVTLAQSGFLEQGKCLLNCSNWVWKPWQRSLPPMYPTKYSTATFQKCAKKKEWRNNLLPHMSRNLNFVTCFNCSALLYNAQHLWIPSAQYIGPFPPTRSWTSFQHSDDKPDIWHGLVPSLVLPQNLWFELKRISHFQVGLLH